MPSDLTRREFGKSAAAVAATAIVPIPAPGKHAEGAVVIEPVWTFRYGRDLEFQTCTPALLSVGDTVVIRCDWEPWVNGRWEINECEEIEATGPAICWLQTYGWILSGLSKEHLRHLNGYDVVVRRLGRE